MECGDGHESERSEVRGQRSEIGSQKPEARIQ
jgi:hypothetical protein